jgi:hypothetical protein
MTIFPFSLSRTDVNNQRHSVLIKFPPASGWVAGTNHHLQSLPPPEIQEGASNSILRLKRMNHLLEKLYSNEHSKELPWSLVYILGDELIERRGEEVVTVYANVACPGLRQLWYTFGGAPAASQGNWQQLPWPW